jgi:uncharacterized heparinase superfamily protein
VISAGRVLGKLRRRSPAELKDRARQALSAWSERVGLGGPLGLTAATLPDILAPGHPADAAALLEAFRARPASRAFPGLDDPAATAGVVRERWPKEANALLARAERILDGRFDLLGHRDLHFGTPIDWQLDPIAGLRAPLVHWSRVPYLDVSVVGDHKVTWEVNRQQWLVTLGQAYAITGEERWARAMTSHMASWLDANPPKLGINWASSLEVAFRAMSWLWALRFLRSSPALEPVLYGRLLESLHLHGRHLETYLSTWFSPNTHLTGEALGLFHIGSLAPELGAASRWQRHGLDILQAQLPIHVHPDGVYFEQAAQYHRYTTDFYTHLVVLAEANGIPLASHVRPTLERLMEHLLHLSRPDGTIPLFGDDDGGRLAQLDSRTPDDVRALLATGAVLFDRADFAFGARGDLAAMAWLLGEPGLQRFDAIRPKPPAELARRFPDGGYHVSRDSWDAGAGWMAMDLGPHGVLNCGHAHADSLSVEVAVAGRPMIVDAGTFSYSGSERQAFRHGAAHNTVIVDGESSSVPAGPFQWSRVATTTMDGWESTARATFMAGSHDGFTSLPSPATHHREVLHLLGDYWVVRDVLESDGAHEVVVHFHLAPALQAAVRMDASSGNEVEISPVGATSRLARLVIFGGRGRPTVSGGWVSPQYGHREEAPVVTWTQRGTGRQEILTFILPSECGIEAVHEVEGIRGGRGFALQRRGGEDLLLVRGTAPMLEGQGVQTDADWLWLRREVSGRVPEYVAIGASIAPSFTTS